jgi:hypothetical protein
MPASAPALASACCKEISGLTPPSSTWLLLLENAVSMLPLASAEASALRVR